MNRTEVENYVKVFWDIPCDDNVVESIDYTGLKHAKLAELRRAGENPADWRPVFLRNNTYDTGTPQCPSGCGRRALSGPEHVHASRVDGHPVRPAHIAASDKKLVHDWYGLLDSPPVVSRAS